VKKEKLLYQTLSLMLIFASCTFGTNYENPQDNQETTEASEYSGNTSSRNIAEDDTSSVSFTNQLIINLSNLSEGNLASLTDSDGKKITATYNSSTGEILISSSKSGESLQVMVTGSAEKAHLVFDNKKEIEIGVLLKDVTIASSGNYPAISFNKKQKCIFSLKVQVQSLTEDFTDTVMEMNILPVHQTPTQMMTVIL